MHNDFIETMFQHADNFGGGLFFFFGKNLDSISKNNFEKEKKRNG